MTAADPVRESARRCALAALDALDSVRAARPDLSASVDAVAQLAQRLGAEAERNPTIAFGGVFDSGKSLLINLLVGMPHLLPVANSPTTGNKTVVRIVASPPGTEPRAGESVRLLFLTADEAAQRAADLLVLIRQLLVASGSPAGNLRSDPLGLATWTPLDPAVPDQADWTRVHGLIQAAWQVQMPELRRRVLELRDLLSSASAGRTHLVRGAVGAGETVSRKLFAQVAASLERTIPAKPPKAGPPLATRLSLSPTADEVRRLYAVIDTVTIEVHLPTDVWDLGVPAADIIDYPGLDSGSARDDAIAADIARAGTVLFVFRADHASAESLDKLYGKLVGGRAVKSGVAQSMVVVANRFDELAGPRVVQSLHDLTRFQEDSRQFSDAFQRGMQFTDRDPGRLVLTSALAGCHIVGYPPNAETTWDDLEVAHGRVRTIWGPAGATLRARPDATEREVGEALSDLAEDGGVNRLRRVVARHLAADGLAVVQAEIVSLQGTLATAVGSLRDQIAVAGQQPADPARQARLETVRDDLRAAIRAQRARAQQLRLLLHLPGGDPRADPGADPGAALADRILDDAAGRVHAWDAWATLFFSTDDEGMLRFDHQAPEGGNGYGDDLEDEMDDEDEGALWAGSGSGPDDSADVLIPVDSLLAKYEETFTELRSQAYRWVDEILAGWQSTLVASQNTTADDAGLLEQRLASVTSTGQLPVRRRSLTRALNREVLAVAARSVRKKMPETSPFREFPLDEGPLLWDLERSVEFDDGDGKKLRDTVSETLKNYRDVHWVVRVRHDLVAALRTQVCRDLQTYLQRTAALAESELSKAESPQTMISSSEIVRMAVTGGRSSDPLVNLLESVCESCSKESAR